MATDPKATVGRTVWYQSHGSPNGQHKSLPRAAIVTETYQDEPSLIGLCVLNPGGIFFDRTVPYDPEGTPGTWRWPPRV